VGDIEEIVVDVASRDIEKAPDLTIRQHSAPSSMRS
jgi:hypothetical protein